MLTLTITPRTAGGTTAADLVRQEGRMPAIVYGPKQEAMAVSISLPEMQAVLRHGGESSLIELQGMGAPIAAQIRDLDVDPVTSIPRHADFYAVEKGAKVTLTVPLSFVGDALAAKAGANIVKIMHEIEVEAAADKLPHEIEVDISPLVALDDQIRVSDLIAPNGVAFVTDADEVVVIAQAPADEESEESPVLDMSAIEVEKKGKAEEETEA
ncbi:MAG: 50S ribosomal protein L25 [Patescibacteria group bacterium]